MASLTTKPLDKSTWNDFARLVEANNGVWGGCWCMAFHVEGLTKSKGGLQNKKNKQRLVNEGRAQAALVYDGEEIAGWCQFGPSEELTRIKNKKEYVKGLNAPPDWRVTCFFVGKDHRHKGVAAAGLKGALKQIASLGGGTVESYPENVAGRKVSSSFLHNGTVAMFEREGFEKSRRIGKDRWVVVKKVRKRKAS